MSSYTPMMQQYLAIKEKHPDSILFFRLGDFYEMFFQDAQTASKEIDLTLTARDAGKGNRVPMAGVPHHAAENYIAKLIDKGYTVAICDQVEDPKEAKGVVRREVTRIITPGTILDPGLLRDNENNYLCAVVIVEDQIGIAAMDISTGFFTCTQTTRSDSMESMESELARLNPAEILIPSSQEDRLRPHLQKKDGSWCRITLWHDSYFSKDRAFPLLEKHFPDSVEEYSLIGENQGAAQAAAAVYFYVLDTQKNSLCHITDLEFYETASYMVLDANARRNLELTQTIRDRKKKGSLLWILDRTKTAMGSRLLRNWIEQPLCNANDITQRLDGVEELVNNSLLRSDLQTALSQIFDLERLVGRSACGQANARDLYALASSLHCIPAIQSLLVDTESALLNFWGQQLDGCLELAQQIHLALVEEPPLALKDGGLIRSGYDSQVDRLREAATHGKAWLNQYEADERSRTGIKNLKIGYNRVFGYYLTVTNSYSHLVPSDYQRKQTLTNAERYTTKQLLEYESEILGAEDRLKTMEYDIFCEMRDQANAKAKNILADAETLACIDALCSLADAAVRNRYTRPAINAGMDIRIESGRHPVVEQMLPPGEFVSNDTYIQRDAHPILLLTGPNMAGKSTYMRQTALIVLMAQLGSFVPADYAEIGLVDRIFTRVGAQDDLASGQSTFMVEMNEMAYILQYATPQSLLLLDEVGRGTSTFDGLSIAWAITEHIHNHSQLQCRTLFATHYHELTDLEEILTGVKNYSIAVREIGEQVIFLHKIIEGGADRSYGIQVARLAGIPAPVLTRAKELLFKLEERDEITLKKTRKQSSDEYKHAQIGFFDSESHPVLDELRKVHIEGTTPLEALQLLMEWQRRLVDEGRSQP